MKIRIDGQLIEQVSEFRHLGSLMSEDRYCEEELQQNSNEKEIFMDETNCSTFNMISSGKCKSISLQGRQQQLPKHQ